VDKHILFQGELFGLNGPEVWTEFVQYLGGGQWLLQIISTNPLSNAGDAEAEQLTSDDIVRWAVDRDLEDADNTDSGGCEGEGTELHVVNELGARGESLLTIASDVGDDSVVAALQGWILGEWPINPAAPTILSVGEAFQKGIWFNVKKQAYRVETDAGPGYVLQPANSGIATLHLESHYGGGPWCVTLSPVQIAQIAARAVHD